MDTFTELRKILKSEISHLPTTKLAILGDSATQFLSDAIKGVGIKYRINLVIFEAEFNQIDRQILDLESELYAFNPEVILIYASGHKLLNKFNKKEPNQRNNFANSTIQHIDYQLSVLQNNTNARIIVCNYCEEDDKVFGQFQTFNSFIFQLRKLNVLLQELVEQKDGVFLCDLNIVQSTVGREQFWSPSIYVNSEMLLSLEALPLVAKSVVGIILALKGQIKKCLILDLDNTLWGGVIGDDGIENIQIGQLGIGKAFTEFQYWIKKLQQRGIILAVCSKNTESVAKEPFEKHPDMILRLSDIAVFIANWENKADNIRRIQKILNIGFDSMVFLDDNPVERQIVRENIPGIDVPELPEDPALYLDYLYKLNLFETVSISSEDSQRTYQYQKEAERMIFQEAFTNEDEFLLSLEMSSETKAFDKFSIPRIAQLSQRSNQFNLRTIRYTEDEVKHIAESKEYLTLSFTLIDKFGDNGLICAIILKKKSSTVLFIDTWFMSCRVLKRGMEQYCLNCIVELAKQNGYTEILGEYIPTPKNSMVSDHYERLGFEPNGENIWQLNVSIFTNFATHIKTK